MSIESRELTLYAENNEGLYRQRIQPVIKNLALKKARGVYDPMLALKLWKYVADDAAQRYTKEFDTAHGSSYGVFTVAARKETAAELAESYANEVDEYFENHPDELPKKYRAKNPANKRVSKKDLELLIDELNNDRGLKRGDIGYYELRSDMDYGSLRIKLFSISTPGGGGHVILSGRTTKQVYDKLLEYMSAHVREKNPRNPVTDNVYERSAASNSKYVLSDYFYVGRDKNSGLYIFEDDAGTLEGFGRFSTPPASWHLKYKNHYYEFVSSIVGENPRRRSYYPQGSNTPPPRYNEEAVNQAIASSNRSGRKIGKRESKAIHALLRGRGNNPASRILKNTFNLVAYGPKKQRAFYTGSTFDDNELKAKVYATPPVVEYTRLKSKLKRGWKLAIVQKNPVAPLSSKIRQAESLYRDFSGDAPEWMKKVKVDLPSTALAFGELDAVEYTTVRDGEVQAYRHHFKKSARPTLAVGGKGNPLLILGGNYHFTERGIEDE